MSNRMVLPQYTVIRDTREKESFGWTFKKSKENKKPPLCNGTIEQQLETGDYSLVDYTDLLSVERKYGIGEIWGNYGSRDLFEEEMSRMKKLKYKYLLIETALSRDHFDLSPPQYGKVPGKALMSWLIHLSLEYGIHIVFVGENGKQYCQYIFESVIRLEKNRWVPN